MAPVNDKEHGQSGTVASLNHGDEVGMKAGRLFWIAVGMTGAWTGFAAVSTSQAAPPVAPATSSAAEAAHFETKVRPLLVRACFSCHAEKVHLSDLRLDSRAALLKGGKKGPAMVPGTPEKSALLTAVHYEGALKMPPAGKLKAEEIEALTRWVKAGAPWPTSKPVVADRRLWAFSPVKPQAPPRVKDARWVRNPVDQFVMADLERRGWKPSPEADRRTLIRRVSLDVTGLPPTPEEVDAFLADRSPNAYERVVDRLLAAPHFGERMAQHWLDLARYADSDGYHDDTDRTMWAYRDYVIDAFNKNKRFDQFTLEQLAGDLLPNATREQKIASAFNRCGPTSSEGGAIVEEYLAKYAVDRATTTATVWMGLTVQCAECHDHKYDPITAKDFYKLFAFFNQVPETVLYRGADAPPTLVTALPGQEEKLAEHDRLVASLETQLKACAPMGPEADDLKKKLEAAKKARTEYDKTIPRLRIMAELPKRRPTHILLRGDYTKPGEEVQPGVLAALGYEMPAGDPPRVALAKWLTDARNPLTARVTVNRFWQLFWGQGLVVSSEDFGTRGEQPSHPALLDWLSARFSGVSGSEFLVSGSAGTGTARGSVDTVNQKPETINQKPSPWNVKAIIRLMVTSATYRQSSRVTPELMAKDPQNRYLARGPRFRLPAEFIRDNALAISGLFDRSRAVGGPSVKPYQPGDLWRELAANDQEAKSYVRDKGPDLYRRGIYTWWKRSILYPAFAVFDAPKRETCAARRMPTNTPLQAFVTLNDVQFVEGARVFAQQILEKGGPSVQSRIDYAFRKALARPATPREQQILSRTYFATRGQYLADRDGATKLVATGESPRSKDLDVVEHAAWTCVCNAILNMDEVLTKE